MSPVSIPRLLTLVSQHCNNFLLQGSSRVNCSKFVVDGYFVGLIRPDVLPHLMSQSKVFVWSVDPRSGERQVTLHPELLTLRQRNSTVRAAMLDLKETGMLPALNGWRNEDYGVYLGERSRTLFSVERSASSLLGITRYGCHINGYCILPSSDRQSENNHRKANGENFSYSHEWQPSDDLASKNVQMWLGVRSMTKPTWPGLLDNMAAGGLTYGLDVLECAEKECQEEASVPVNLLKSLKPVGRLSYIFEDERGICPQVEYCFDLELPCDFKPEGADGEVASFQLASISQVTDLIVEEGFKSNSAMVVLDFLYRHKFIDPESDTRHAEIQSLMHVKFEFD